jgi:putative zinc finger protein
MMHCHDIDELMVDFLYQELDAAQADEVKAHVDGCKRCGAELQSLQRTRQAVRALPDIEPPGAVTARLLHEAARRAPRVEEPAAGAAGWLGWLTRWLRPMMAHPAWAAAATLLLVAGVAGVLMTRHKVTSTMTLDTSEPAAPESSTGAAPAAPAASPAPPAPPAGATTTAGPDDGRLQPRGSSVSLVPSGSGSGSGAGVGPRDDKDMGEDLRRQGLKVEGPARVVRPATAAEEDRLTDTEGRANKGKFAVPPPPQKPEKKVDVKAGYRDLGSKKEQAEPAATAKPSAAPPSAPGTSPPAPSAPSAPPAPSEGWAKPPEAPREAPAGASGAPVGGAAQEVQAAPSQPQQSRALPPPSPAPASPAQPSPPTVNAPAPGAGAVRGQSPAAKMPAPVKATGQSKQPSSPPRLEKADAPGRAGNAGNADNAANTGDANGDKQVNQAKSAPRPQNGPSANDFQAGKLHELARQKAASGNCREALTIRSEINKIDPGYYRQRVVGDQAFAACDGTDRKALKPAPTKNAEQRHDAPAPAAPGPAADESKTVK